jgi:hypothetical protein
MVPLESSPVNPVIRGPAPCRPAVIPAPRKHQIMFLLRSQESWPVATESQA